MQFNFSKLPNKPLNALFPLLFSIVRDFKVLFVLILSVSTLSLGACHFPPRIYRMDVQQGNLLTPEMICKLRVGMSKQQVQEVLGTPTLTHVLDNDRWDYYYSLKPGSGDPKVVKHFPVYFRNGRVVQFG